MHFNHPQSQAYTNLFVIKPGDEALSQQQQQQLHRIPNWNDFTLLHNESLIPTEVASW